MDDGLDMHGIVEQAFHQYDSLTSDDVEQFIACQEVPNNPRDVVPPEETQPTNGSMEKSEAYMNMPGMACPRSDYVEDQDEEGWWDAPKEWLIDDDFDGLAGDPHFQHATSIFLK